MNIENKTNALVALGNTMKTKLQEFKTDRTTLELQLLKNLRQYRGKYDPDVEAILNSADFKSRSKVYPKDTRTKVIGFVAKMMEMMFPAAEKNFALEPTPYPNIPETAIDGILKGLQEKKLMEAQAQMQNQPQGSPPPEIPPLTDKEIEEAVLDYAKDRALEMEKEIEDQLADIGGTRIEYAQLCKKVLRSAGIYGYGILEGPLVRTQKERGWEPTATGSYRAVEKKKRRPFLEHVKVWDLLFDLSAKNWYEQEGVFRRRVFLKNGFLELGDREGWYKPVIEKFVRDHPDGNYIAMSFESDLDEINNTSNVRKNKKGKYEVFRYLGFVSAQALYDAGVEIEEDKRIGDIFADIWFVDDQVISADLAPFGSNPAESYHIFLYEDDEESGNSGMGLPEVLRDSQMRLCAVDRAMMDNMAAAAGPIWEVNKALLGRGHGVDSIHSFQVIHRDDDNPNTARVPAVRQLDTTAYISEYIALRQEIKQVLDFESNLPAWLMGDAKPLGEAFRTSNNMSMMTGGANMITKDVVRSFDRFTVSVISALVMWNMEFNDKKTIKGDFQVQPKGNLSLVAKEVRGMALDQLWATLTPEERAIVKVHKILTERFKSRDLPADYIEDEDKAQEILDGMAQAQAAAQAKTEALTEAQTQKASASAQKEQAQAQEILSTIEAKINTMQANIEQSLANAKGVTERGTLERVKLLLEDLRSEAEGTGAGKSTTGTKSKSAGKTSK